MRWGRIVVLLTAATLWPGAAFAASGWLAWLEELSGPGPFSGFVVSAPVLCTRDGEVVSCWSPISPPKRVVNVSVGWLGSGHNLRFKDLPDTPDNRRGVDVLQVSGAYLFRLHPAFDAGLGAGFMRFSGDGFEAQWRFTLVPITGSVRPFALVDKWKHARWASILRAEMETSFVTSGFKASQFGSSTSTFSSGPEFLTRAALVIDLGSLVWR
jgi:hypothetical protein